MSSQKSLSPYPNYSSAFDSDFALPEADTVNSGSRPLLQPLHVSLEPPHPSLPPRRKTRSRNILQATQRLAAETWRDVVGARWRRGGLWYLFFLWAAGLLGTLIVVSLYGSSGLSNSSSACQPDGSFSAINSFNPFAIDNFFEITLTASSEDLTFTEAKLIDVAWDIVSHACTTAFTLVSTTTYIETRKTRSWSSWNPYAS